MPHVTVKLWPGKTEAQKKRLAEAITREMMAELGASEASLSVAIEEIAPDRWRDAVYLPDIAARPANLYKKPGYTM